MAKICLMLAWLATGFATAWAQNPFEQPFAWTPSASYSNVPSYVLYWTTNPPNSGLTDWRRLAVTNTAWLTTTNTITNGYLKSLFAAGVTNWVLVTARDPSGVESEPSNIIPYVPPPPPKMMRLLLQTAPTVNGPWTTLSNVPPVELPLTERQLFARLKPAPPSL